MIIIAFINEIKIIKYKYEFIFQYLNIKLADHLTKYFLILSCFFFNFRVSNRIDDRKGDLR
jgi:hypothetical protein